LHLQVGLEELVPAVRHLVEYERNSLAAADTIAAAEGVVAAQPDVLLHRIVAQFQHLFDCHHLEGVLPALNQVTCSFPLSSLRQAIATTRQELALLLAMASSCHHTRENLLLLTMARYCHHMQDLVYRAVTASARQLLCGRVKLANLQFTCVL
jgi:hypothetical protein